MRAGGFRAGGLTIKVRYSDFRTITRSRTLWATDRDGDFLTVARGLLAETLSRRVRVRLLGVSLDRLRSGEEQLQLFAPERERKRRLLFPAVDLLRKKFGFDILALAMGSRGR